MNTEYTLEAKSRQSMGTANAKKIRRENGIPAVVYGDIDNNNIVLDANEVAKQVRDSGFYSSVIQLKIDKDTIDVILKDLQRDPTKSYITHMDFFAVDKNKAVVVNIPIMFTNEDTCAGVKLSGGIISHIQSELEISCLPKDLPDNIVVDIAELEIGHSIHLSEIKLPANVELATPIDDEHDSPVVSCYEPKAEKIEEVVAEPEEGQAGESGDNAEADTASKEEDSK
jgi:large subunit ribosomal protein L25